jgi:hypothetical protein
MKPVKQQQQWYVFDHSKKFGVFNSYKEAAKFVDSISEPDEDLYQVAKLTESEFTNYWEEGLVR